MIGERIEGNKVTDKLGEGGFGRVYKVEDPNGQMYFFNIQLF